MVLIGIITGSIIGCFAVMYVVNNSDGTTGLPNLNNFSMDATSIIWVRDEKTGEWVEYEHLEGANAVWVDIEQIPRHMQLAVIAIITDTT
jgi:membrane peptidoglycan carboxypeptidase